MNDSSQTTTHDCVRRAIESRTSVHHYQAHCRLSDAEVESLVGLATRAPSAYNFQNWRFLAVRSAQAKERLKSVAYGQQKVVDASAAFIVCGTLAAHETLACRLEPAVEAGILTTEAAAGWVAMAGQTHAGNLPWQRDEAIRSASLAAMTLMLAAQGMGWGSCAMTGFDAPALSREFGLSDAEVPVVVVTVGQAVAGDPAQKPRRPLADVLVHL